MENKRGQTGIGLLVIGAVAIIVALILFQSVAANVNATTRTATLSNGLYTAPAAGSCIDLVGQELLSTPTVTNRSDGATIPAANYTIAEGVSSVDNLKRIRFCTVGALVAPYSTSINVSYSYGPEGYTDDAGARAIIGIIVLLAAIGIAVALLPVIKTDF